MLIKVILKSENSTLIFDRTIIRQNWHDQHDAKIVDESLIENLDNAFLNQIIAVNGQDYKVIETRKFDPNLNLR